MHAQQTRKSPAERAGEFAATQARLKQEAADRRAVAQRAPKVSTGTGRRTRGGARGTPA